MTEGKRDGNVCWENVYQRVWQLDSGLIKEGGGGGDRQDRKDSKKTVFLLFWFFFICFIFAKGNGFFPYSLIFLVSIVDLLSISHSNLHEINQNWVACLCGQKFLGELAPWAVRDHIPLGSSHLVSASPPQTHPGKFPRAEFPAMGITYLFIPADSLCLLCPRQCTWPWPAPEKSQLEAAMG